MELSNKTLEQSSSGFPPELLAEHCYVDGGSLFRFTFGRQGPDLSDAFCRHVTHVLSQMDYDHITINCPHGHPDWLTTFFTKLVGYGLPVEVTPAPTNPDLIQAVGNASRLTRFKWPEEAVK